MRKDIVLCGVGGQGTVLASRLISAAAMAKGIPVQSAETIGMAQRGGSVFSHLRLGEGVECPMIARGEADLILGFEPGEVVRMLPWLKKDGWAVVSSRAVMPVTATLSGSDYQAREMLDYLAAHTAHLTVVDAERAVYVAADALRADITVEGGASYDAKRRQHKDSVDDTIATTAKLKFSAPWDRRRERNAYRRALITLEQCRRALQEEEDAIKNEVRAGYRDLVAARVLYENKVEAYKTACMRVAANDLFMQAGRSSMRDILEAESALLTARNALCSAVIDWRMSDLTLRNAMGLGERW